MGNRPIVLTGYMSKDYLLNLDDGHELMVDDFAPEDQMAALMMLTLAHDMGMKMLLVRGDEYLSFKFVKVGQ